MADDYHKFFSIHFKFFSFSYLKIFLREQAISIISASWILLSLGSKVLFICSLLTDDVPEIVNFDDDLISQALT